MKATKTFLVDFRDPKNPEEPIEFPALGILFFNMGPPAYSAGRHAILIDRYDEDGRFYYISDTSTWIGSDWFPDSRISVDDLRDGVDSDVRGLLRTGIFIAKRVCFLSQLLFIIMTYLTIINIPIEVKVILSAFPRIALLSKKKLSHFLLT